MFIAFLIWTLCAGIFLAIGISSYKSKEPAGFFTFSNPPKVNDVEGYENIFLQVYTEKMNPHQLYNSDENSLHYFHQDEDGTYFVECDREWEDGTSETLVYKITVGLREYYGRYDIEVDREVDAKDRVKLELIPFSQYK